jgi:hypothetical protein
VNLVFEFDKGAGDQFDDMMQSLAKESGYQELAYAPVIPIGHSAAASYPWNFAAWNPARTLAVLSIHGDAPLTNLTGSGRPNPDWGNRTIEGVPGLMVQGEYEWWEDRVQPALNYRMKFPKAPVSFLADAGHGHFDFSDAMVSYLCMFIQKAVKYSLPAKSPIDKPVKLKPVDPSKGWLGDRFHPDKQPAAPSAPFKKYKGDPKEAFWYCDRQMALATERFYAASRGKLTQYIGYVQDGNEISQNGQHSGVTPKFIPMEDGVSFRISAKLLDSVPATPKKPAVLANGHANGPVSVTRICGPVVKTGEDTFALQFYRMGFNNSRRSNDIWLIASHPGDGKYKSVVQQCNFRVPLKNVEGKDQQISFPAIPDQKEGVKSLPLTATSNASMPVYYYVQEGPAEIEGGTLRFTQIPPRSKFPVKVTVVAWQYGRSLEPKVKSAEPVTRSFYIFK